MELVKSFPGQYRRKGSQIEDCKEGQHHGLSLLEKAERHQACELLSLNIDDSLSRTAQFLSARPVPLYMNRGVINILVVMIFHDVRVFLKVVLQYVCTLLQQEKNGILKGKND